MPKNIKSPAPVAKENTNDLKSITIAVGSYEGGLLVYIIDLIKGCHIPYFSAEDNLVILFS